MNETILNEALKELSGVRKPQKDLWPEIEAGISRKMNPAPFRKYTIPLSMAAGAAILFFGLFLGMQISGPGSLKGSYLQNLMTLETEYNRAKPISFQSVRYSGQIPDSSLDAVEAELDALNETWELLMDLMKAYPEDPLIYSKALELYQRKMEVLTELNQLSNSLGSI